MTASSKKPLCLCFLWLLILTGCSTTTHGGREGTGFSPELQLISFFKTHISPVDGDRCQSYPTCATYAEQAFRKHGFVMGWMMTVDRLIHEGNEEASVTPFVYINGEMKIFDPVENNDFWWGIPKGEDHD
jgi:hypothetical protein